MVDVFLPFLLLENHQISKDLGAGSNFRRWLFTFKNVPHVSTACASRSAIKPHADLGEKKNNAFNV